MLCTVCRDMLRDQKGLKGDTGTRLFLTFEHDTLAHVTDKSQNSDCFVCRTLAEYLSIRGYNVNRKENASRRLTAILQAVVERRDLFRLDFKLDGQMITSFVLQANGKVCRGRRTTSN
jgi:hypothetical protein